MKFFDFFKFKEKKEIEKVLDKLVIIFGETAKSNFDISGEKFKSVVLMKIKKDSFLSNFFSKCDRECTFKVIKAAENISKKKQINEVLEKGAFCIYSLEEIAELGFSEKDIEKIIANNYNEIVRLVEYSDLELLKMGLPISEIKKIRKIYKKMETLYKKKQKNNV